MMHTSFEQYLPVAGRVLLGVLFLIAGWGKLTGFEGTVGFVASAGFPMPEVVTVAAIIVEFGGALMLIAGFKTRIAAWALAVFTLIATFAYHNVFADPSQQIMFLKNLAIIGGLLYVARFGSGMWSMSLPKANAGA
jgi:putative oxidoreductase